MQELLGITRAPWKAGLLRVEATSTNPKAILGVYSQAGNTVKSKFGGSASANVGG